MKTYLIILVCLFWGALMGTSQTCDIQTNGMTSTPSILTGSGTSLVKFQVFNDAGGPGCSYPANSVLVVLSIPADGITFQSFASPVSGDYFNWFYDPLENIVYGINDQPIGDEQGDTLAINFLITATTPNIYPECRQLTLDILNNPDGPIFPANVLTDNDDAVNTITILPTPGASTVNCFANATQPIPPFNESCDGPTITYVDTPNNVCEGTRVYSFAYTSCTGSCVSSVPPFNFTWTYTYTIDRSIHPTESGGPVVSTSNIKCASLALPPLLLPVVVSSCGGDPLAPAAPLQKSQFEIDFSNAVLIGATAAPNTWYTDRYVPFAFEKVNYLGGDRLKHSIDVSACDGCRGSQNGGFYNTQGRKYDLGAGANYAEIDLYVPSEWQTTGRRMAGFWATAFNASNVVSGFPIIEFTSENMSPRFRVWPNPAQNNFIDLGLPSGFVYNSWVKLKIRLLPSGEFLFTVGNLNYQTTYLAANASVRLGNVILQGHNTSSPGVSYDIYWDNFIWRENYVAPSCEGKVSYTYDHTDCAGLVYPWTYTYNVKDDVIPTFTRPADITIFTDSNCTYNAGVAFTGDVTDEADNCSVGIQAAFTDAAPVALVGCVGGFTITRTWSLVDNCTNAASNQIQTITVRDTIVPTFTRPADITIFTDVNCAYNAGVAFTGDVLDEADNCSVGIQATFTDAAPIALVGCVGGFTITRTWSLVDNCTNAASNQIQTITVRDNIVPTFTRPADITIFTDVNCAYNAGVAFTGDVSDEADNCSVGIQATFTDAAPVALVGCAGGFTITRTWSLVDNCTNAASNQIQTITVRDNIVPTFTRPADITIFTDSNCTYNAGVAFTGDVSDEADNCSVGIQATFTDAAPLALVGCAGGFTITRTWSLVDNCTNAASNQIQTITVRDNIVPTFTRPADITIFTDSNCTYNAGVAFTGDVSDEADNCSVGIQATFTDAAPVALVGCAGGFTITRTWSLVDNCTNAASNQIQTITVRDNIVPTFTRPADITIFTDSNCTYNAGVAFTGDVSDEADNCSVGIQATFTDAAPVALVGCAGGFTITRTWSLVDNCTNAASNQIQTITVRDNIAPTFTRPADITIFTDSNCTYNAGVAFTGDVSDEADNCSVGIQATFTDAAPVALVGCAGGYTITRTWSLVDNCTNAASNQIQTITIRDNIIPVISRLGDPTVYICQGSTYTDAGATASDNCSGNLTANIVTVNPVTNLSPAGSYTVTYNVVDACGNNAVQVTRTVIVRELPSATITGTATVLQNAPTTPVVTFTGASGTGPYTFNYTVQFNSDPVGPILTTLTANPIVTVPQSNAVVGVFTYTLVSVTDFNGCTFVLPTTQTAVITVISACDLSPTIPRPINGAFLNGDVQDGVIQITNAGPAPTSGNITFRISNISNFGILIPPLMMSAGSPSLTVHNTEFDISVGPFFTTITSKSPPNIPAGGNKRIGFIMTAVGFGGSNGNLTATIINGTGSDNNNNNNKAVRTFVINAN